MNSRTNSHLSPRNSLAVLPKSISPREEIEQVMNESFCCQLAMCSAHHLNNIYCKVTSSIIITRNAYSLADFITETIKLSCHSNENELLTSITGESLRAKKSTGNLLASYHWRGESLRAKKSTGTCWHLSLERRVTESQEVHRKPAGIYHWRCSQKVHRRTSAMGD